MNEAYQPEKVVSKNAKDRKANFVSPGAGDSRGRDGRKNRNSNFRARAWKAARARVVVERVTSAFWVSMALVVISMGAFGCSGPCKTANALCESKGEPGPFDDDDVACDVAVAECVLEEDDCSPETIASCISSCGDGVVDAGEACDDGNNADGDGCETDCTITIGPFEITNVRLTPDVNVLGGVRPRFTDDMAIDVVVETTEGMTSVEAEVVSCNPALVSDCTPVSDTPPSATSWSLRLPGLSGGTTGNLFTVQVTAEGSGGQMAQQTVDVEVYPVDPGLDVTCTRRYDSGSLYVAFTLVDNGNLPIDPGTGSPYTLADMFDARFWVSQEGEATGFTLDETDSFRGYFALVQPTEFNLDDDGVYEMVFTGLLGFVDPIQAHLLIDTIGGDNDVCTLVP